MCTGLLCTCSAQENKDSLSHQESWLSQGAHFGGLFCKEDHNKVESLYSLRASQPQRLEGLHASIQKGKSFLNSLPPFLGGVPVQTVSSAETSDRILTFGRRPPASQAEAIQEIAPSSCPAPPLRDVAALWRNKFSET